VIKKLQFMGYLARFSFVKLKENPPIIELLFFPGKGFEEIAWITQN
jgi:hypothetical protein